MTVATAVIMVVIMAVIMVVIVAVIVVMIMVMAMVMVDVVVGEVMHFERHRSRSTQIASSQFGVETIEGIEHDGELLVGQGLSCDHRSTELRHRGPLALWVQYPGMQFIVEGMHGVHIGRARGGLAVIHAAVIHIAVVHIAVMHIAMVHAGDIADLGHHRDRPGITEVEDDGDLADHEHLIAIDVEEHHMDTARLHHQGGTGVDLEALGALSHAHHAIISGDRLVQLDTSEV